jgi:RNA polymerase sigma-70 factor, ECF subfamily
MEQQRVHDRDRIWVDWMRAANDGDEIAYRRLLEALVPLLRAVVRRGFARSGFGSADGSSPSRAG